MDWRLEWSPAALRQIEERAEEIALDSPEHSARWVASLFAATESLPQFPRRGRRVPEADELPEESRELVVGDYRLIYFLEEPVVLMVAMVHGRRDLAALWAQRFQPPP